MTDAVLTLPRLVFVPNENDSAINQRYYRVSKCGRYSVSKCVVADREVFDAWRLAGIGKPAEHLGNRLSFVGAAELCRRHAAVKAAA